VHVRKPLPHDGMLMGVILTAKRRLSVWQWHEILNSQGFWSGTRRFLFWKHRHFPGSHAGHALLAIQVFPPATTDRTAREFLNRHSTASRWKK